ncbi:MAG: Unknown protein [uncultured Aureispira sp.]|uniref:Uncharacterized protein n=1 Tax=uncultured Aureispira sp. TaxID=1331704 RepID=A0A6S6S0E4_9BACT|nr:MAG: Unknown protein [uncultured Aureispira sp.]
MKIELAHDTLAKSIYDKFSEEDKMRAQIRQLLMERLLDYKDHSTLLSKDDLNYMDSYIDSIELSRDALNLVRESKQRLKRRKKHLKIVAACSIVLLVGFNLITRFANQQNEKLLLDEEQTVSRLAKEDSLKRVAEARADMLYQQLLKTNPEFTQDLIASFDTLKTSKEMMKKERNIAQSSTLSALGQAALKQADKNYAFQLASKAWELNPENKLACELLYKISDDPSYGSDHQTMKLGHLSKEEHHVYVANLIAKERSENGRGELAEEKLQLIFNQGNTVVHNKDEGVKDRIERYYDELEDKASSLKSSIKKSKYY